MKTADRRNRILILYVALLLGLFAYERIPQDIFKSRPRANHGPAGTIFTASPASFRAQR